MDMINERLLLDVVNGNPGATAFALEVLTNYGPLGEFALTKMLDADIKGDKLYMLWNDCCNRVTGHALRIIMTHDIDDILTHIKYAGALGIPYIIEKGDEE